MLICIFLSSFFKNIFWIILSICLRASNHHIVDKKNCSSFTAFRTEIRFHSNPGLSLPSFEQTGAGSGRVANLINQ